MGKSEDFSPQNVQKQKEEKEKREAYEAKKVAAFKREQERKEAEIEEKKRKEAVPNARMAEVMSRAINDFSLDLALGKFGDISHANEEKFQKLKSAIKFAMIAYLEKNPGIKQGLYDAGIAEKNTQEIIRKRLRDLYFSEIKSEEPMDKKEEEFEGVVKKVLTSYLARQNPGLQKNGIIDIGVLEKREKMAEDFIRSIAMKFFKENTRPPSKEELSDLVKRSLEV